ncbi:MAG: hypothetical protein WBO24_15585 [Nitrospirales bacterium]
MDQCNSIYATFDMEGVERLLVVGMISLPYDGYQAKPALETLSEKRRQSCRSF